MCDRHISIESFVWSDSGNLLQSAFLYIRKININQEILCFTLATTSLYTGSDRRQNVKIYYFVFRSQWFLRFSFCLDPWIELRCNVQMQLQNNSNHGMNYSAVLHSDGGAWTCKGFYELLVSTCSRILMKHENSNSYPSSSHSQLHSWAVDGSKG